MFISEELLFWWVVGTLSGHVGRWVVVGVIVEIGYTMRHCDIGAAIITVWRWLLVGGAAVATITGIWWVGACSQDGLS